MANPPVDPQKDIGAQHIEEGHKLFEGDIATIQAALELADRVSTLSSELRVYRAALASLERIRLRLTDLEAKR